MKTENLIYLSNAWDVICDNEGTSYSFLNDITKSILSIENDTNQYALGLNISYNNRNTQPFCRIILKHDTPYKLSKTNGLKINYKVTGDCSKLRVHIIQHGQNNNDPMFYQDIDPQEGWSNIKLKKEHFNAPAMLANKKLNWDKIVGFQIEPFSKNGEEVKILIKEFIVTEYEIIFYSNLPMTFTQKSLKSRFNHFNRSILDSILHIYQYLFNRIWKTLHIYFDGSNKQKQKLWDKEYKDGVWDYLSDESENTEMFDSTKANQLLEKYCSNASVLDLGCGVGTYVHVFEKYKTTEYLGLDFSSFAIEKAKRIYAENNIIQFDTADILTYNTNKKYDLVYVSEVIFYFTPDDTKKLIHKYCQVLTDRGVICIKIYDISQFKHLIEIMMTEFSVVDYVDYDHIIKGQSIKGVMLFLRQ